MQYTFPHDSCEVESSAGALRQPYSAVVSLASVVSMMFIDQDRPMSCVQMKAVLSYILFQTFHSFSHMVHYRGLIQVCIAHALWYLMCYRTYNAFFYTYGNPPTTKKRWIPTCVYIDILCFLFTGGVYSILTDVMIMVVIVLCYAHKLQTSACFKLFACGVILAMALILEATYCQTLIKTTPVPPHVIVEIIGGGLFYTLAKIVLQV